MLWRRLNQKASKLVSDSWQGHLLSCPRQIKKVNRFLFSIVVESLGWLNGYFCPEQINNSSKPFRPEIPLKRISMFFSEINRNIVLFPYPCSPFTTERALLSVIQMTWLTFIWIPLNPICDVNPLLRSTVSFFILQPFDNWKDPFVCHSNDVININMNSI